MTEVVSDQIFRAVQALIVSGIAAYAYKTAKEASLSHGKWWAGWRTIAWCFGIALFAAAVMGNPSCEVAGDPMRGGCEVYADDGYSPSFDGRLGRFLFFAIVLTVPGLYGVMNVGRAERARWESEREHFSDLSS